MEIVSASRFVDAKVATAMDKHGREHLVVVAKASWVLPRPGERPRPLPPEPIYDSSQPFRRESGASVIDSLRCDDDLAPFKPRCDVVFDACAHAPGGKPVSELGVGFLVGDCAKALRVLGARRWHRALTGYVLGKPESFDMLPLHYGLAHGGTRSYVDEHGNTLYESFRANPEGRGWAGKMTRNQLHDAPAAQIEALDDPIRDPGRAHRVAGLGAIPRHWPARLQYAGTMDERWRREVFPFLPEDFDERFHQAAPEDQQIEFPRGGERVRLINLLADQPELEFRLPSLEMPVRVLRRDFSAEHVQAHADTLFFETEERRFSVVWRTQLPVLRHISEFDLVAVGKVAPEWWRQRSLGLDENCVGCSAASRSKEAESA